MSLPPALQLVNEDKLLPIKNIYLKLINSSNEDTNEIKLLVNNLIRNSNLNKLEQDYLINLFFKNENNCNKRKTLNDDDNDAESSFNKHSRH